MGSLPEDCVLPQKNCCRVREKCQVPFPVIPAEPKDMADGKLFLPESLWWFERWGRWQHSHSQPCIPKLWPYLGVRFHSTCRCPQMGERRDAETILLFKLNNKWGFNHEPIVDVSQTTFRFDEKGSEGSYTSGKALFLGKYHHALEWDYAEWSEPELEKGWLSH